MSEFTYMLSEFAGSTSSLYSFFCISPNTLEKQLCALCLLCTAVVCVAVFDCMVTDYKSLGARLHYPCVTLKTTQDGPVMV